MLKLSIQYISLRRRGHTGNHLLLPHEGKMEVPLRAGLDQHDLAYKNALERIINKYTKLCNENGAGWDVALDETDTQSMEDYMNQSEMNMSNLESKSMTCRRDESLSAHNVTKDSELDFTYQDCEPNETRLSTGQVCVEDDEMSRSDSTRLTQRTVSELDFQPEDQDEELEMSLSSQGSSLVELYPSMIAQIERAWQRQHVSQAGGSVLRRYRKWRRMPNRSNLNNTFDITLRGAKSKPKKKSGETILEETFHSPSKRRFPGTSHRAAETSPPSPLHKVISPQEWHTQLQSPGRDRGTPRRKPPKPVLVMDFSYASETSESKKSSLKKTSNVAPLSPPSFSQSSFYAVSPRPHCASASSESSLRFKRLPLSAHSVQTAGCSIYGTTGVKERSDIYGSPVRQSPLKARMMMTSEGLSRSPTTHAFSRSPKSDSVSYSREPMRSRLIAKFLSSPSKKPDMQQRMIHPQESNHSFQSQQHSPPANAFSRSPKSDSVSYSREPMRSRSIEKFLSSPSKKPDMQQRMIHPQESHHCFQSQQHSPRTHAFSRSPKSDSVSYSREPVRSRSMAMFLSSPSKKPDMQQRMIHPQESHHCFQSQQHSPRTHAFSRSPKSDSVSYSREPVRSRSMAMFLSSPSKKPDLQQRMIHPQESHQSFQSQQHSPISVTAAGRHKFRRHLSFGSSLPQSPSSYSKKELDDDFAKVYHKFVCQNKSSPFRGASCRLCARSSEASRGHSSSALAALALSPHRFILRKRHRQLHCDSHPQSKRFREMHCTYSPGSKRHGKEMLTQFTQQPSALAAEFSGLGGSLESKWQLATSAENGGEHNRKYIDYGKTFSKRPPNNYYCGK
ncbi:uncharacterized protein si:dkeyp-117h8.4 [Scomber scombrus]|uniref:Uncharacterized protein si:dkeyp-117h8.4 n=1 Tax=Scomber scombrus TaxID=13677 RepID=A0AAV1NBV8_SCOSC